ncbi:MAG: HEPN domain-containing protein [Desulfatiglandaceae bacterium]
MNIKDQTSYWLNSAHHDLEVAQSLFEAQKYDWCLFVGHLVLEKALKACFVNSHQQFPPKIHDLVRIAFMAGVELDDETAEFLDSVNAFNISTRYPDEKLKFYKMCTHEFTAHHFKRIREVFRWICQRIDTLER